MEDNQDKLVPLAEIGEFGWINHLKSKLVFDDASIIKGVGDDAAVVQPKEKTEVITTDMLMEGIHFDLIYTPLKHLGYKAVVSNISDVLAMNVLPSYITTSIAVSSKFSKNALDEFYQGVLLACQNYNVSLIGGDTCSSKSGLAISITCIGYGEKKNIVYRDGAKENDLICVTGDLGAAYLGLQILEREKMVFKANPKSQPDLNGMDYILERQLKPEARLSTIKLLKDKKIKPTAMMDISDGLASEIMHICKESNCGAAIYEEKIPIDFETVKVSEELNLDPTTCALNGGEDYELLFTISQKDYQNIKDIAEIAVIGHITDKNAGCSLITRNGTQVAMQAQGWTSF